MSIKDDLNTGELIPSKVSRKTVADGSWLQKYTLGRLSARDDYLADCIDDSISVSNFSSSSL